MFRAVARARRDGGPGECRGAAVTSGDLLRAASLAGGAPRDAPEPPDDVTGSAHWQGGKAVGHGHGARGPAGGSRQSCLGSKAGERAVRAVAAAHAARMHGKNNAALRASGAASAVVVVQVRLPCSLPAPSDSGPGAGPHPRAPARRATAEARRRDVESPTPRHGVRGERRERAERAAVVPAAVDRGRRVLGHRQPDWPLLPDDVQP
mmetsp:Transcript_15890/g.55335  ORF Transcript_15890/g.55335 Transcript_15890/m.55335 type:complete len:207 (+) Transcript_15890:47-667(+)